MIQQKNTRRDPRGKILLGLNTSEAHLLLVLLNAEAQLAGTLRDASDRQMKAEIMLDRLRRAIRERNPPRQ